MSIWDRITEFFTAIWEILTGGWGFVAGATWDNTRVRRFITGALISFGVCILIMILGFLLKLKVLIVVASALAAIIAFAAGKVLRITIKALIKLIELGESGSKAAICRIINFPVAEKILKPLGDITDWTATELSKALREVLTSIKTSLSFVVTVSMTLAFIGALTAIRGVGYYSLQNLMVISTAVLFTFLFFVYIDKKVKTAGYLMYGVWLYFFVGGWLFPIQVQGTLDWLESKTIRRSLANTHGSQEGLLVAIPAGTPFYTERFGNFFFTGERAGSETRGRVINRTNDPDSKEPMYEVKLPVDGFPNLYVGGKTRIVPASLVRPVQQAAPEISGAQEEIVHFYPGKPAFTKIVAYPGDTVQFINPTVPFKVPGVADFHRITETINHISKGFGNIVAYGDEQEGFVLIRVTKNRKGGDI